MGEAVPDEVEGGDLEEGRDEGGDGEQEEYQGLEVGVGGRAHSELQLCEDLDHLGEVQAEDWEDGAVGQGAECSHYE